jgi:AraC-like DNA-binding protein
VGASTALAFVPIVGKTEHSCCNKQLELSGTGGTSGLVSNPPLGLHNAELLALVAPQLEFELTQQLAQRSLSEQVKGIVKKLLAGQRPTLQDVARELRMSTRTLQRRLTTERAKFQQLMEEARRELAQHYLLHSSLELNETAYLLGYEDANSFFCAFHQWEGTSPGEWRPRMPTAAARTTRRLRLCNSESPDSSLS